MLVSEDVTANADGDGRCALCGMNKWLSHSRSSLPTSASRRLRHSLQTAVWPHTGLMQLWCCADERCYRVRVPARGRPLSVNSRTGLLATQWAKRMRIFKRLQLARLQSVAHLCRTQNSKRTLFLAHDSDIQHFLQAAIRPAML